MRGVRSRVPSVRLGLVGAARDGSAAARAGNRLLESLSGYIRLARDLGCNAFRFSIAWARVEPCPRYVRPGPSWTTTQKSPQPVRDHGMGASCHVMSLRLADARAMGRAASPGGDFPARFAEYAGQVRDAMAPHVRYWLTFNEPNDLAVSHSQLNRRFPPSAPDWVSLSGSGLRNGGAHSQYLPGSPRGTGCPADRLARDRALWSA